MALNIPKSIRAGDTLKFTDSVTEYPAGDGWVLSYNLSNKDGFFSIASTASGDKHNFNIPHTSTQNYKTGSFKYAAKVTDGTDVYTISDGTIEVLPDISNGAADHRHHVQKVLDALEAMFEGKATHDQSYYTIGGRSLARLSPDELLKWRDKYRAELLSLKRADDIAKGIGGGNKIYSRF